MSNVEQYLREELTRTKDQLRSHEQWVEASTKDDAAKSASLKAWIGNLEDALDKLAPAKPAKKTAAKKAGS